MFNHDLKDLLDIVKATITYGDGKIDAEQIAPRKGQGSRPDTFRFAPSFVLGRSDEKSSRHFLDNTFSFRFSALRYKSMNQVTMSPL